MLAIQHRDHDAQEPTDLRHNGSLRRLRPTERLPTQSRALTVQPRSALAFGPFPLVAGISQ